MHCVDLDESFPTSIYLQNLASIQPRTSPKKFGKTGKRDFEISFALTPVRAFEIGGQELVPAVVGLKCSQPENCKAHLQRLVESSLSSEVDVRLQQGIVRDDVGQLILHRLGLEVPRGVEMSAALDPSLNVAVCIFPVASAIDPSTMNPLPALRGQWTVRLRL